MINDQSELERLCGAVPEQSFDRVFREERAARMRTRHFRLSSLKGASDESARDEERKNGAGANALGDHW